MSLFTTTLAVSFLVVATPHLLPCPVDPRTLADSQDPDALSGQPRRRRRRILKEETCNDTMSEERRKMKEAEEWATPKRECPVPKPGGLIGQVLGLKKAEEEEEQPSVTTQIQRARRKPTSEDGEGS
jgi:cytochrome c oxidase assembly factor 2